MIFADFLFHGPEFSRRALRSPAGDFAGKAFPTTGNEEKYHSCLPDNLTAILPTVRRAPLTTAGNEKVMELHKPTFFNSLGKRLAGPLSAVLCSRPLQNPARKADAYLNFLLGKGSGTGWDIDHEILAASTCIRRPNPTVFDVGANVGLWSTHLLKAIPQARVFMFEPSPICQSMIRNLELAKAELIPCAVGEHKGVASLHFSSETDATASLHERSDSYFAGLDYRTTDVQVTTVDEIIATRQIEFVDLLKLDIEGHELFALKGAAKAFAENRIGAVTFEFGSGNINSRTFFKDFWNLFTAANFSISRITPGGILIPVTSYYEDLEYFRGVSNYMAKNKVDHPFTTSS